MRAHSYRRITKQSLGAVALDKITSEATGFRVGEKLSATRSSTGCSLEAAFDQDTFLLKEEF